MCSGMPQELWVFVGLQAYQGKQAKHIIIIMFRFILEYSSNLKGFLACVEQLWD